MKYVTLQIPTGLGAVNTFVTDSKGSVVADRQLTTPKEGQRVFSVPGPGLYTIYCQPIGSGSIPVPLTVENQDLSIDVPAARVGTIVRELVADSTYPIASKKRIKGSDIAQTKPTRRQMSSKSSPQEVWLSLEPQIKQFANNHPSMERTEYTNWTKDADSAQSIIQTQSVAPEEHTRKISIGISSDTTPDKIGGWRPYFGRWPVQIASSAEETSFTIRRQGGEILDRDGLDGSRVRITVAVERKYMRRFLVPLLTDGVQVRIASAHTVTPSLTFSITPTDSRIQILAQALVSNSPEDARRLTHEVEATTEHFLPRVLDNNMFDPWIATMLGLIIKRFDWTDQNCDWCVELAQRYPWIPDTLVLAAWWKSRESRLEPSVIEYLAAARRRGALYFSDANTILGDLLVWLAADAEEDDVRQRARHELALWRENIHFQSRLGANFAWLTKGGDKNNGHVSSRYCLVAYEGTFADFENH